MNSIVPYNPIATSSIENLWELETHCQHCINSKDLSKYKLRKAVIIFLDERKINTTLEFYHLSQLVSTAKKMASVYIVMMTHSDKVNENFEIKNSKFKQYPDLNRIVVGETPFSTSFLEKDNISFVDIFRGINDWLTEHKILLNEANIVIISDSMVSRNPFKYCVISDINKESFYAIEQIQLFYNDPRNFGFPSVTIRESRDSGCYSEELVKALPKKLTCSTMTVYSNQQTLPMVLRRIVHTIAENYSDLMTVEGYENRSIWFEFSEKSSGEFPSWSQRQQFVEFFKNKVVKQLKIMSNDFQNDATFIFSNQKGGFLHDILQESNINHEFIPKHKVRISFRFGRHAIGYAVERD